MTGKTCWRRGHHAPGTWPVQLAGARRTVPPAQPVELGGLPRGAGRDAGPGSGRRGPRVCGPRSCGHPGACSGGRPLGPGPAWFSHPGRSRCGWQPTLPHLPARPSPRPWPSQLPDGQRHSCPAGHPRERKHDRPRRLMTPRCPTYEDRRWPRSPGRLAAPWRAAAKRAAPAMISAGGGGPHRGSSGNGRVGRDGRMVGGDTARMPAASQRRAAKAAPRRRAAANADPAGGPMPPELEAKLIAPDEYAAARPGRPRSMGRPRSRFLDATSKPSTSTLPTCGWPGAGSPCATAPARTGRHGQ